MWNKGFLHKNICISPSYNDQECCNSMESRWSGCLGVFLDNKSNWNFYVNVKLEQGYARLVLFYPLINWKSSPKPECAVLIKNYVQTFNFICLSSLGSCSVNNKIGVQRFQNKVWTLYVLRTSNYASTVRDLQSSSGSTLLRLFKTCCNLPMGY